MRGLQSGLSDYNVLASNTKQKYNFNLCSYTKSHCLDVEGRVFGYKTDEQGNNCLSLTDDNLDHLQSSVEEYRGEKYVKMNFTGGQPCIGDQNYSMIINLKCNAEGSKEETLNILSVDANQICSPVITVSHKNACPVFSATTFSRFFIERPYILGPIAIIFGLVVSLAGRKFFPWTIGIIGGVLGASITLLLFSMFNILDSIKDPNTLQQSSVAFDIFSYIVALTTGLFMSYILQKMLHIGAAILGAIGGFFLGVAAYNLLFFFTESEIVLSGLSVLGSITMAFLSFRYYDDIVIFSTAFVGTYSFTRGISFFIGNFPNETTFFS